MGIYEVDGETDDIVSMADRAYIARQTIKIKVTQPGLFMTEPYVISCCTKKKLKSDGKSFG